MVSAGTVQDTRRQGSGFRHEALFYADRREFLAGTLTFIQTGLAGDEPTLVVVDADKIAALRAELGGDADRVMFADMSQVGRNPARIIYRWQRFVADHLRDDRPVRGIGEPIWSGRSPAELVECQAHETLLNVAFGDGPAWTLLCPYDTEALEPAVVDEARRSHQFLVRTDGNEISVDYVDQHPSPARLDQPLPPAPADAAPVRFGPSSDTLREVREVVLDHARRAGLDTTAAESLVLAVNEVATNSLCHGGGRGTVRLWREGGSVICQVSDEGRMQAPPPLLGRFPASIDQDGGRGLWLANQLCDLVQIRSGAAGTTVRLHVAATAR